MEDFELDVGVAKIDVTPDQPWPLGGMHRVVYAKGTAGALTVRAFVMRDDRATVAIVSIDVIALTDDTVASIRASVSRAFPAIGQFDVLVACSHTHSAPLTKFFAGRPANRAFLSKVEASAVQAIGNALSAMRSSKLYYSATIAENLTFNRRPIYATGAGEQVATHGPKSVPQFLRMEGPVDETLQVIIARDDEDGVIGGLVAFASHPTLTGRSEVYSADYCGVLVERLSEMLGGMFAFLQGASGDLTPNNPDEASDAGMGIERAHRLGNALATLAAESTNRSRMLGENLSLKRSVVAIKQRQPSPEQLELARTYLGGGLEGMQPLQLNRLLQGHDFTFFQDGEAEHRWFCEEALGMWEWQQRSGIRPMTDACEVAVLDVGGCAIAMFPVELFAAFGLDVRRRSARSATIVATLANGWHGYVPTEEAFDRGGYEPRFGHSSRLVPAAGSMLVKAALDLLSMP